MRVLNPYRPGRCRAGASGSGSATCPWWRSCSWRRCCCSWARRASSTAGAWTGTRIEPTGSGRSRRPARQRRAGKCQPGSGAEHECRHGHAPERYAEAARRPGILSWSAPATSGSAARTATRRPPRSWTGSREPCSRRATTRTRTARSSSSARATTPAGVATAAGPDRRPATTTGRRRASPATSSYFGDAAKGPGGTSWYSYDLGTWHVIVLDSMCSKVGGCGAGLAAGPAGWRPTSRPATRPARWRSSITRGSPRASTGTPCRWTAFWRPLYAAGVDVVVNGHDHDYERFDPQDPDGRADPCAGHPPVRRRDGRGGAPRLPTRGARTARAASRLPHGVLAFTLHQGSYEWQFIAARNDFRQRGVATCH